MSKSNQYLNAYDVPYTVDVDELPSVCRETDVNLNSIADFGRVAAAFDSPSLTSWAERLLIFGLVVALKPQRVLEIGFLFGGTSFVILCALTDVLEHAKLVSVDPHPRPALDFEVFGERFHLLEGRSPRDLDKAAALLGGSIDFCLIDGDHSSNAVEADLEGIRPFMSRGGYVLLHDACYPSVIEGVNRFLNRRPNEITDCGRVASACNDESWGGLRLLRY